MTRHRLTLISILLLSSLLWGCAGTSGPALIHASASANEDQLLGEWREHWGGPGDSDVTYNDRYRISRADGGHVVVATINRNQRIFDVSVQNGVLHFTQRTDTFEVRYRLILPGRERWMIGSATPPQGSYPIIWARVREQ